MLRSQYHDKLPTFPTSFIHTYILRTSYGVVADKLDSSPNKTKTKTKQNRMGPVDTYISGKRSRRPLPKYVTTMSETQHPGSVDIDLNDPSKLNLPNRVPAYSFFLGFFSCDLSRSQCVVCTHCLGYWYMFRLLVVTSDQPCLAANARPPA
jgi:hypothetical protein